MNNRITRNHVSFIFPFRLDEIDEDLPAGDYTIETEEQYLDGLNFVARRRIDTVIILQADVLSRTPMRFVSIDPERLDLALAHDRAMSASTEQTRMDEASLQRAENEGMSLL